MESLLLTGAVATATAWRHVGAPRFTPLIQEMSDVAVDAAGRPYIAFSDQSKSNRATVMTYRDGAWTTVGPAGFSSGYAYGITLALDPGGAPWVAFYDNDILSNTCVMRWLNNRWVYVGAPGFAAAGQSYYHQLAFDAGGTPYVAYRDATQAYKATVQRFTNGTWAPVGAVGVTGGQADYVRMAVDASTGVPYIAFRDNAQSSYLSVMKFEAGAWAYVGARGFTTPSALDYLGLAVRDGSPVVSYRDNASNKLNVQRWDATAGAWTSLSTPPVLTLPPLTASDAWWKDLERATDASTSQIVYSVPLDLLENTAWKAFVVGRAAWVRTDALGRACACVSYYLYAGAYSTDVTAVSAFTAQTFVARGATTANDTTAARTSALAFLSGRWVTLTDPRLGCDYNSVRIASDGAPVVAFRDTTRGNMLRVAVFRSGAWTVLSDAMGVSTFISLAAPSAVSLALTSADVPVVALMDTTRVSVVTIDEADAAGPVTPAAVRLECRAAGSNTVTFSGLAGVTDARGATTSVRVSVGTEPTRSTERGFSSSMLARVAVPAGASEAELRLSTAALGTTDLVYGWVDASDDRGNVTRSGPFPAPLAGMWVGDRAFRGLAAAQSASGLLQPAPHAVEVSAGWLMSPPAAQPAQAVLVVSDAPLSAVRAAYVAAQLPLSGASVQELAAATAATSAACWTAFPMAGLRASSVWRESDARLAALQGAAPGADADALLQAAAATGLWSALSEARVSALYAYLVSTAPGGAPVASAALAVQLRDATPPVLTGVAVAQASGGGLSVAVTAGSVSDGGRPGRLTAFLVLARAAMSTQALAAIPNLLSAAPAGSVLAESGYAGYGAALQLGGGKLTAAQFWTGSAFAVLDDSTQTTLVPHVFATDAAGNAASVALPALSLRDATGPRLESLAFEQSATDYRVSATAGTLMEARTDGAVAAYVVLASAPKSAAELQALNGGDLAGALETGAWQALPSATSAGSLAPLHGGPALPYPPAAMSSDAQALAGLRYGGGVYSLSTNKPLRYGRLSNLTNGRTGGAVADDDATWAADLVGVGVQEGVACTWTVTLRLPSAINVTRYTLGAPLALPAGGPRDWKVLFYTDQTSTTASFTDTRTGVLPATWATGALQDFALSGTASGVVRVMLAVDFPNAGSGSRVLLSHFRLWAAAGVSASYVDRLPAMTAGLMTDNTGTVVYPRVNANWSYAGSDGVYTVTASGEADAPRTAWRMFNKTMLYDGNWTDDTWASSVLPAWAQVRLPALQVVTSFVLATPALSASPETPVARLPKAYSFIGVSDAGAETVLYSTAAEAAPALTGTEYQIAVGFTNAVAYRSYKLSVTACQSGGYLQIGELRLYASVTASVVTVPLLGATAGSEDPTDDGRRATKLLDADLSATSAWYSAPGVSTASVTLKASALCAPTQAVLYSAASNAVFGGASTLARGATAWGVNSDGSEVLLGASSNLGYAAYSGGASNVTAVLSAALPLAYPLATSLFSSFRLQVAADGGEAAGRVNLTGVQLQCAASPAPALTCTRYLDAATGAFSNITQTSPALYPHVIATDAASNTSLALLSALTVADRSGPLLSGVSVAQGASNYTYTVLGGSASDAKSGGNLKAYLVPSATAMTAAQLYAVNTNNLDGVIEAGARLSLSNYVAGSNASLAGLSCTKYLSSGGAFVSVSDLFPAAYDPASGAAVRLAFENPNSLGDNLLGSGGAATVGVSYLRQWPPAALTADSCWLTGQPYGGGAYFATASSSNAVNRAFGAFDGSGAASWQSASNVVSGVTLGLELPAPIKLHSFVLLTGAGLTATAPAFGPKAFVVYGVSPAGVDTALLTVATQTYSARPGLAIGGADISTTGVVSVAATVAYSKFKLVVGSTYSGAGYVEVVDWTLFESATDLAAPTGPDNAGYGDLVVLSTAADDSGAAGMSVGTYLAGTTVTLRNAAGVPLRTDVCANANSVLTYAVGELGAGYTITGGGKPLAGNHNAGNAAASTNVTSALYYFAARYSPIMLVVYCPTADVSVSVGFGAANDGSFADQTFTGSGSARTAISIPLGADLGYFKLTASAPVCAMVYSGDVKDFITVLPPATTLLGYNSGTAYGIVPPISGATMATSGLAQVFKASAPMFLYYAGTGGEASATAAPVTCLSDTYMVPHVVGGEGYKIVAIRPTVVSVYAVSNTTGTKTLVATHDLSTASETVPGVAAAGAVAGGTSGAYFVGTAPFALRLDNAQSNEYVALGVMSPAAATAAYGSAATGSVAGRYGYGIARTSGTLYSGSIAAPAVSLTAGWSAAYWLKVDAALWARAAATDSNLHLFDELPGALCATFGPSGLVHGLVSSTRVKRAQAPIPASKLPAGSWRHVAVTVAAEGSSARVKQYVDGSLWYSCTDAVTTAASYSSLALTLASAAARPLALDLALDDLRVYARALTDAEVSGLCGAASGSNASGGGFPLYLNVLAVDNSSNLTLLQPPAADVRDQTVPTVSGLTVTQSGTDYKFTAGAGSVAEGRPGSLAAYLVMSTAALSTAQLASMRASGSLDSAGLDAAAKLFNSSYAGSGAAVALNTLYTYRYWDAGASAFAVLADGVAATLYPHAAVFDAAGNAASQQLAAVTVVDRTPPSVSGLAVAQGASNYTFTVTAGLTRDDRSSGAFKAYFFMGNAQNMTATTAALDAAAIEAGAKLSLSNYVAGSNASLSGLSCTKYWNGSAFLTTTETAPFPVAVLYPHVLAVDGSAAANATWSWLPAVNIADRGAPTLTGGAASNNNAADYRVTLTAGTAQDGRAGLVNVYLVLGTSALSSAQMVSMRASGDLDSNLEASAKYANPSYAGSNAALSLGNQLWSSKYWNGGAFATLGEADVGRAMFPNVLLTDAIGNAAAQQLPAITVADRTGPSIGGLAAAQGASNYAFTVTAGTSSDLKSSGAFRAYFFMGTSSNMTATATAAQLDSAGIEAGAKLSLSNYVAGSNVSLAGLSCTKYWSGSGFTAIAEIIPASPFTLYPHVLAVDGSPGANPATKSLAAVTVADRNAPTIAATTVAQSATDYRFSVTAGSVSDARAGPLTSYLLMASAAISTPNLANIWAFSNLDAAIETSARLAQPSYAAASSTPLTSLYAYQFWHAGSNAFQAIGELSPALFPHVLSVDAGSNPSSTQLASIAIADKTAPTVSGLAVTQGASNYAFTVSAGSVVDLKGSGLLKAYLIPAVAPMTAAQLYAIPALDASIEATAKYTTAAYVAGSNVSLVGLGSTKYVSGGVFTSISETVPGTPFQLYHHLLAVDSSSNLSVVTLPAVTVADRSAPVFSVAAAVAQSGTDYRYSLTAGSVADGRPGSIAAYLVMALSGLTAAQLLSMRATLDASLEAGAKYSTGSYTAGSALNLGGVGMHAYTYWTGTGFAPIAEPTGALYPHLLVVDGAGNPALSAAASTTPADRTGPTVSAFSAATAGSGLYVPDPPPAMDLFSNAAWGATVAGMTGPVNGIYSFSNCTYASLASNAAYPDFTYVLIARSDRTRVSDFASSASKVFGVERRDATSAVGLTMRITETDYSGVGVQSSAYTLDGVTTPVAYLGQNKSFQAYCWRQSSVAGAVDRLTVDVFGGDGSVRLHGDDQAVGNPTVGVYHNFIVQAANSIAYTYGPHRRYAGYMSDFELSSVCEYLIAAANGAAFDYAVYGAAALSEARTAGWIRAYLLLSASAMTAAELNAIPNLDRVVEGTSRYAASNYATGSNVSLSGLVATRYWSAASNAFLSVGATSPVNGVLYASLLALDNNNNYGACNLPAALPVPLR